MMGKEGWTLLGRLRKAVKKISFLLKFDMNKWKLASMIGGNTWRNNIQRNRTLSFNDRPGLRAFIGDEDEDDDVSESSSWRGKGRRLERTISYPSKEEDDIDKRAENFIANFYKQLQIERQISLELIYARENSFNISSSP